MIVKTKEDVFAIMGKYYGNAHWRSAVKRGANEEELRLIVEVLDRINALGYNFSNLHRLTDHEDIRFIPIVLEYIHRYGREMMGLLQAFEYRSYSAYTPDLIALYKNPEYAEYRWSIGNALRAIRHKKYVPQYLELVSDSAYGSYPCLVMEILCMFRVKEALPRLLELYERYPDVWRWTLLESAHRFNDPVILPYIEPYLTSDNGEYRQMAKKVWKKFTDLETKAQ